MKYVDIIIIGSGMSGLYSAYKIKEFSPNTSFIILEKYKKHWIGGRTSNETFYGTEIVTGAGIGRKNKDKLLHKLLSQFNLNKDEYTIKPHKSKLMTDIDIKQVMSHLKREYKNQNMTFKQSLNSPSNLLMISLA